jgi:two-component system response regulator CpxR
MPGQSPVTFTHYCLPTPRTILTPQTSTHGPIKVLIADDDRVLAEMLKDYLESEGCEIDLADDGRTALRKTAQENFDILVLDIMMPGMTGIEVLKQVRASRSLPVIMLTARGDDLDRILGLELGADDYLAKPCNPRELLARIRAVLRRTIATGEPPDIVLETGDLKIDPANRRVVIDIGAGIPAAITLTQTEFDMLYLLLSTPERLVSKSDISQKVLDRPLSQWDRSIDVHISNLRKKLGPHANGIERIKTLRGSGYLYQVVQDPG